MIFATPEEIKAWQIVRDGIPWRTAEHEVEAAKVQRILETAQTIEGMRDALLWLLDHTR